MKSVKYLILALVSLVTFTACNKEVEASLVLERSSLYFSSWEDEEQVISYVPQNAVTVAVASYSMGWDAYVDMSSLVPTGLMVIVREGIST